MARGAWMPCASRVALLLPAALAGLLCISQSGVGVLEWAGGSRRLADSELGPAQWLRSLQRHLIEDSGDGAPARAAAERRLAAAADADVRPVYWLHFPKCGSSFATVIAHHTCGDLIREGVTVKEPNKFRAAWGKQCPGSKFGRFANGHGPLGAGVDLRHVVVMVRQPASRVASGYLHNLHDCERMQWQNHIREQDNRRTGLHTVTRINLTKYGECVGGCMTNMLLGKKCASVKPAPLSDHAVAAAAAKVRAVGFVGLTEEWLLSVCLFHAKFGGKLLSAELVNVRKAPKGSSEDKLVYILNATGFVAADHVVYAAARERFYGEVKEHGLTAELCRGRVK